jgi:hypothetical protein
MGFSGLTSGERKRLQQGILTPEQATLISARAEAKSGGGGFWTSTWGQVVRGVGIAALNFVPGVGGIASQALGAYDKARFTAISQKAKETYQAELVKNAQAQQAARAGQQPAPVLETLPEPWLPNWGSIGGGSTPIYQPAPSGGGYGAGFFDELQAGFGEFQPWQWYLLGAGALLLLLIFLRGGK